MSSSNSMELISALNEGGGLRAAGAERLRSKEDPASVARDLSHRGLPAEEIQSLFHSAASKQRRSAITMLIIGAAVSLIIIFGVWAAMDAGFTCMGPGLAVGLFIMVRAILALKNASEIARVGDEFGSQTKSI